MAREYKEKPRSKDAEEIPAEERVASGTNAELAEATDGVLDRIDDVLGDEEELDLLADIDGALEENAAEFVLNYVQRGGE